MTPVLFNLWIFAGFVFKHFAFCGVADDRAMFVDIGNVVGLDPILTDNGSQLSKVL